MGSLTRTEKETYLLMNGWWAHYHMDCWFDGELDELDVNGDGLMIGFRDESEGITLDEAYDELMRNKQGWKKINSK